jgi:hypothetical protein
MVRRRRGLHQLAGDLEARRVAATLGGQMHHTRLERRLTLAGLADLTGTAPTRLHELEAGDGASAPLAAWFAVGSALDRPFAAGFSRDIHRSGEPADAGHLAAQEIVLSLSRRNARTGMFELRTRSGIREGGNVDVGIRDDRWRALTLVEIWNTTADLGAASRSSARKVAEAGELAAFRGYWVASCWLWWTPPPPRDGSPGIDTRTGRIRPLRFRQPG